MQQGSEEWLLARCGKVTASRVHDIVATTRSGGYSTSRKNYLAELVCERLTGTPAEQYVSAAMVYGQETEAEARKAYAFECDADVVEVGFVPHPTIAAAGASPDGTVGEGLVEFKCPNTATMIEVLLGSSINPAYADQCHFQMACTGAKWVDLVTYDRRLPPAMRMHIQRIMRDDKAIAKLETEVVQFLIDLDATVDLLRKRYMQEQAA